MKRGETGPAPRQSAEERREAILDAAIAEFAAYGLYGTSTERIAARVGISQPYIFRLFGTKKELFVAAQGRVYDRVLALFTQAAAAAGERDDDVLDAMGQSYTALLARRDELLLLLHGFAASGDPEVRAEARARYDALYRYVARVSGADDEAVRQFFAYGMLCTVAAAIDLPPLAPRKEWWDEDA